MSVTGRYSDTLSEELRDVALGWAIVGAESFRSCSVQLSQSQDGFSREVYYLASKDYGRESWSVKQYTRRTNDQNAFTDNG